MDWKKQIKGLKAYQPGRTIDEVKEIYGLDKVVKLASNENPFGYSSLVDVFLRDSYLNHAIYPDGYAKNLRTKISSKLGVNLNQILLGNGSDEIIQMISRALLQPGKNTVMAIPTFPQYKHNATVEGAEVREVALNSKGEHRLDEMLEQIDNSTTVVWLCSPNNPTGTYITEKDIISFLDNVPEHVLVVLDEAYYEYVVADHYYDSLELLKIYPNLLVTRTFSKAYGLAGFRVGYAISSEEIISQLEPLREPFNNNSLGQGAAAVALQDQEFIAECRQNNKQGLERFYQFCDEEGLLYYPSQGNFILIDFGVNGDEVFQFLLSKGYIVRSGQALGFPTSVRVTIGSEEENKGVIEEMKNFIKEAKQEASL
ncbi:histidinol-phosphate aminotransferase [Bacillus pakistanensis]|uniref:Histidinol-phosphate aminotransferase n=1 Tax=Rossellomorea pakistanensis TaxID=992288 RepID=A0ABS2N9A1_9BACI|nr:histidinol-phosphate aminotransferase [Bacillus pakistanensis]